MSESESGEAPAGADPRRLVGQVISGRYRIEELIGEGGMGAVYRAEHTHMRKRLAVKVLHPGMSQWAEAVERFEREAIAGAHIEHPNVAAATDFGVLDDGAHFLVMEFLQGEDLRSVIAPGPLRPERAAKIARQIALALGAAHRLDIVHRDLKPENVMLVRRDRDADVVKVLDFGVAKVPVDDLKGTPGGAALTKLGMVYGTPEYVAPEQALGEEIDARADLYALGVVFYEMLCGVRPFEADNRVALLGMVAMRAAPRPAERVPGTTVPRQLEDIVMRLLQRERSDRHATADAVVEEIDQAILDLEYARAPGRGSKVELDVQALDRTGPTQLAIQTDRSRTRPAVTADPEESPSVVVPRPRLRDVPVPALLLGGGAAAIVLVVAVTALFRHGGTVAALASDAPVAPDPSGQAVGRSGWPGWPAWSKKEATREELDEARTAGAQALAALAERYPRDAAVLEALMLAQAREPAGLAAALDVAKRLLELRPESAADEDLRKVVRRAALGPQEVSAIAFDLMQDRMGSAGPDLLYEIASGETRLKDRANKALSTQSVLDKATPALRIANELRRASSCQDKKPLLERAAEDGDERALAILSPLVVAKGRGCGILGLGRCPAPCAKIAEDINAAISAIEGRSRK